VPVAGLAVPELFQGWLAARIVALVAQSSFAPRSAQIVSASPFGLVPLPVDRAALL
jgi:hypothetical protein